MNMNSFQDIKDGDKLIAQIYNIYEMQETIFPTPGESELQFGFGISKEKKVLKTHIHKKIDRKINNTSEFLFVIEGQMDITIFNEKEEIINKVSLSPGMAILQFLEDMQ